MKRGTEFHIKPKKEEFTWLRSGKLDGEVTQPLQERQNFDRQIREEEVVEKSITGRRKGMSKAKLV